MTVLISRHKKNAQTSHDVILFGKEDPYAAKLIT